MRSSLGRHHAQAAALRWAADAMGSGKGKACIEAALRAATSGTLDKGAEAREAGNALVLALLQVPVNAVLHCAGRA